MEANRNEAVPFLPRIQTTRQLSTIFETNDETKEELSKANDVGLFNKANSRRHRFSRRVHSCDDILWARKFSERHSNGEFFLPPLPNTSSFQRQSSSSDDKIGKNLPDVTENVFADFSRPRPKVDCNVLHFDVKVRRHSTKPNLDVEKDLFQNKENIVASWLQFFG